MTGAEIVRKKEELKGGRGVWESHWQQCLNYVVPRKANITRSVVPGEKRGMEVLDGTAIQANETLAGALHGILTNPTTLWFELSTGDQDLDAIQDVKNWLQDCSHRIHAALNDSNFQTEIHEVYLDLGSIGTACMIIEDDEDMIFRFSSISIADVYLCENAKKQIDQIYRTYQATARQISEQFGEAVLDDELKSKLSKEDKFEIIHCVYPRDMAGVSEIKKKGPKGYKFASKYVLVKSKKILSESGFQEWPFVTPRWTKTTGETYGRSPAMKCLPDILMAQEIATYTVGAAQKALAPPLSVPDGAYLGPISTKPNALNFKRKGSQEKIEAFGNEGNLRIGFEAIGEPRNRIKDAYYISELQLGTGPQMTAAEVQARMEDKMKLLGPVMGRQQSELLKPMIDRIFMIMFRKGKLKKMPDIMKGKNVGTKYSSLVARAQRMSEGNNAMRFFQSVAPIIQLKPEAGDNLNPDVLIRFLADVYGITAKALFDEKTVADTRKARQKAQQNAVEMQQEQHAADVAGKIGPAAAKAKMAGLIE